ncbi:survival motor neuron protein (SMN) domain-containing protein [Ditylenchus destructor]|uniref:Survival motor neuron protein (SMN) domain-containing protein n=1 Tax=Ditylenchus destructor TaxID=166010 RepID=A0AAD4MZ87_9BILA|nr:survival motor neuron protein (SMN) domain-containing protein [Ditylenchus destructor]
MSETPDVNTNSNKNNFQNAVNWNAGKCNHDIQNDGDWNAESKNNGLVSDASQNIIGIDQSLRYSKVEMLTIGKTVPDSLFPVFTIKEKEAAWQTGDYCMAKYSEDGLYYFGQILSISADGTCCEVLYTDYKVKETVKLTDLLTDYGIKKKDMTRVVQSPQKRGVVKNENAHSNAFTSVTKVNEVNNVNNHFSNLTIESELSNGMQDKDSEYVEINRQLVENYSKQSNPKMTKAEEANESRPEQQTHEKDSMSKTAQNKIIYSNEEILNVNSMLPKTQLPVFCDDEKDAGCANISAEINAEEGGNRENNGQESSMGDRLKWYLDGYRAGLQTGLQVRSEQNENFNVEISGQLKISVQSL